MPWIKDAYFLCFVNENHFNLFARKGRGEGGGDWTQMFSVLLYDLITGHITCNISSRTSYIAWLCNMLYSTG